MSYPGLDYRRLGEQVYPTEKLEYNNKKKMDVQNNEVWSKCQKSDNGMSYSPTRSDGSTWDVTASTPELLDPSCVVWGSSTAPLSTSLCSSPSLGCSCSCCCCCGGWCTPLTSPNAISFSQPCEQSLEAVDDHFLTLLVLLARQCNIGL